MPRKNQKTTKKNNVVRLEQMRQRVQELKAMGQMQYRPKYGREIARIEKELKRVA